MAFVRSLCCAFLLAALVVAPARADTPERRVALVIGQSRYVNVPHLANTANDARLMARTLQGLGFTLVGGGAQLDLDKPRFDKAVQAFARALPGSTAALFYYAGHGLQMQGANFLVPVDANPVKPADADFELVDVDVVLRQMEAAGARLNLVLLDACRNNPFGQRGLRGGGAGLAQMQAPKGTLISYATQPGNVASDGTAGGDSPYATALSRALKEPGRDVFELFNAVGVEVDRTTGGTQQPWLSSSPIEGNFYFAGRPAGTAPAPAPAADTHAIELAYWQSARDSNNAELLNTYLKQYPQGEFAAAARAKLAALPREAPAPAGGGYDGTWNGTASCAAGPATPASSFPVALRVAANRIHGALDQEMNLVVNGTPQRAPGHLEFGGQIGGDGAVVVIGKGSALDQHWGINFTGKVAGGEVHMPGAIGNRRCQLDLTRQ